MYKTVLLQAAVILVVAGLAVLLFGPREAVSVLIGGAAYFLPNLLFVTRLNAAASAGRASAASFIVGELIKIVATIGILVVAQRFYDVHWLALLVGLFAALKSNLFALLLKH
jgi:ATP synthase protein I